MGRLSSRPFSTFKNPGFNSRLKLIDLVKPVTYMVSRVAGLTAKKLPMFDPLAPPTKSMSGYGIPEGKPEDPQDEGGEAVTSKLEKDTETQPSGTKRVHDDEPTADEEPEAKRWMPIKEENDLVQDYNKNKKKKKCRLTYN
jgi:hypothetical protein